MGFIIYYGMEMEGGERAYLTLHSITVPLLRTPS